MSKHIPELTDRQLRNFWLKVSKRGPDNCWEWLGYRNREDYGMFGLHPAGVFRAPRVMYYLATGVQPGGLHVCHKCDAPSCCNPAHLFLGTDADNAADRDVKGRLGPREGVNNGRAKLTEKQVLEIRASNASLVTLAARYGVCYVSISQVKSHQTWKHI
jgi:hypothetical protein